MGTKKEIDFEEAYKELTDIVEKLEKEDIKLDEAMALYENGVKLVRICGARLDSAQRKVNALKINADGEVVETEFDVEKEK